MNLLTRNHFKTIAVLALFTFAGSTLSAQNNDNGAAEIGEKAFDMLKNFAATSPQQFANYFSAANAELALGGQQKVDDNYYAGYYKALQQAETTFGFTWNVLKFETFNYKVMSNDNGFTFYRGRLWFNYSYRFNNSDFSVDVLFIKHHEKYYLFNVVWNAPALN